MKKISLLFATLLVLVSSIIFCGCNDGYKKLKIDLISIEYASDTHHSNEGEIDLVLDDAIMPENNKLANCQVVFGLSGAKKWGEVSVTSNPSGVIKIVDCKFDGKDCIVTLTALQPVEGAEVVIKHLGSGKTCSVPLNIGKKLKNIESNGMDYIIEYQKLDEGSHQVFDIPTKQLLSCTPANYTDTIVWKQVADKTGVEVRSYDDSGEMADFIQAEDNVNKINGTSRAVKSQIIIDDTCRVNTIIEMNPISIFDGIATLHKDIVVKVCVADLLQQSEIVVTSSTHGDNTVNRVLQDLVLISNPDSNNPRPSSMTGYDAYSTALIDFNILSDIGLQSLGNVSYKFKDLYEMTLSTNINALTLEHIDFGKVRAIATSTCFGSGEIVVKFVPKACVGDVEEIQVSIPCTIGERATSFSISNNGEKLQLQADRTKKYTFTSKTALNDSDSLGQKFSFEVLSVNTLTALKSYKIIIKEDLLYVNPKFITYVENIAKSSPYIRTKNDGDFDLSALTPYDKQISILKDGHDIKFYADNNGNFVSEPLSSRSTIYMKWVQGDKNNPLGNIPFAITVQNYYDGGYSSKDAGYNIKDNGFAYTEITCNIEFNAQRTVARIEYTPVVFNSLAYSGASDAKEDWQFYFNKGQLYNASGEFYGLVITKVFGIDGEPLTDAEASNINLTLFITRDGIDVVDDNINLKLISSLDINNLKSEILFNFDNILTNNIICVRTASSLEDGDYGQYQLRFTQTGNLIDTRNILVYKQLDEDKDIRVSISNADFSGKMLQYEYVELSKAEWDANNAKPATEKITYYELAGGQYIMATKYNLNTAYYKQVKVTYQTMDNSNPTDNDLDLNSTYILSTDNQYSVVIDIENKDFVGYSGQSVDAKMVSQDYNNKLDDIYAKNLIKRDKFGNSVDTDVYGSYNNARNYAQLTYTISINQYDYYTIKPEKKEIKKVIYIYVYEPIKVAVFDKTMLYKYDSGSINNSELKEEYSKELLTININNNDAKALNYVDIKWLTGDGTSVVEGEYPENQRKFSFVSNTKLEGRMVAILTQFGVQYPIYCAYEINRPVSSEYIVLNNKINVFKSGAGYINLKAGETFDVDATTKSTKGETTFKDLVYMVCSQTGYKLQTSSDNGKAMVEVDTTGKITANFAGKAKLIIVAKDQFKGGEITNYFSYGTYVANSAHLTIDILISDGSEEFPYLIASVQDFIDFVDNVNKTANTNNQNYALVADIDLNGKVYAITNFAGHLYSYQEDTNNNRFKISGIMLGAGNPSLFTSLGTAGMSETKANIENIDFYVDIDYNGSIQTSGNILIGLIGTNYGYIKDITITLSGRIDVSGNTRNHTIGLMTAVNNGAIEMEDTALVCVTGDVVVKGNLQSTIYLGGVVGQNDGVIIGAHQQPKVNKNTGKVDYKVYYGNQGAMVDVSLRLTAGNANSAIGGVIGYNTGLMQNVYSAGEVLGVDDANNLKVSNVGGLIGKNSGSGFKAAATITDSVLTATNFVTGQTFQINNCYSDAIIMGNNNIGGAVGNDEYGSYYKVYYEMYSVGEHIKGNDNVGGLIGCAVNSGLMYCYAQSFAWDYSDSVATYDVVGVNNVGGLIGLGKSNLSSASNSYTIEGKGTEAGQTSSLVIIASASSINVSADKDAGGLIGRLEGFAAIKTTYYYGVINLAINSDNAVANIYNKDGFPQADWVPYMYTYSIVKGVTCTNDVFPADNNSLIDVVTGFAVNAEYNNGKPYVEYTYVDEGGSVTTNLVSVVPTIVQIENAFNKNNAEYIQKDNLYIRNDQFGDYVRIGKDNFEAYDPTNTYHQSIADRYLLMASLVNVGDSSSTASNYREKALVLYYYQFTNMTDEYATIDMKALNTVDMHDIVDDDGIVVLPETFKRFNLRSDNTNIISVLDGGKLLLKNEGQATITLISALNPSATASFVVIVRTKVHQFGLYSNANIHSDYKLNNKTIDIVKDSSKIIYADFSSTISQYNRIYNCKQPTNMGIEFTISAKDLTKLDEIEESKDVDYIPLSKYITLSGKYEDGAYYIKYGEPITITVNEYADTEFEIIAKPYIIVTYTNASGQSEHNKQYLTSLHTITFNVKTKSGPKAINANKTQLEMMPADDFTNLDVKINTDIAVDTMYFELYATNKDGTIFEFGGHKFVEMLDIYDKDGLIVDGRLSADNVLTYNTSIDVDGFNETAGLQELSFKLKLNENSHYVDIPFTINLRLYVTNGKLSTDVDYNEIWTNITINVLPQTISSVIVRNYRNDPDSTDPNNDMKIDDGTYQSPIIRPGSTNIITIDVAPNVAIYDHVNILDLTTGDKILFKQVKYNDGTLNTLSNMDTWVVDGIKLTKIQVDKKDSKLYVIAKLPTRAMANITHTIQIDTCDVDGKILNTTYLSLEAVMYPTIELTYAEPNGAKAYTIHTTDDGSWDQNKNMITALSAPIDLAVGVEAAIEVGTYNIDAETLNYSVKIIGQDDEDYTSQFANCVRVQNAYGKYVLYFNLEYQNMWSGLLGKYIDVSFTASKSLNGITESCMATMRFTIRKIVIHGISMTHTTSKGDLYGDWVEDKDRDEGFLTQFYFDKTDISYYNNGYWRTEYYMMSNTAIDDIIDSSLKADMTFINNILKSINANNDIVMMLYKLKPDTLTSNIPYNSNGIEITNDGKSFKIIAQDPNAEDAVGIDNINDFKLYVKFNIGYNSNYPVLNGTDRIIENTFGFDVRTKTTPFDKYEDIWTQEDFENMVEGRFYRLMQNMLFSNYTPINTAIGGLNGNGKTITFVDQPKDGFNQEAFNDAQLKQNFLSGDIYIGLFGTLAQDTIVQNLNVEYKDVVLNLQNASQTENQSTNNIYFGGIAGQNLGMITNVNVFGNFELIATDISPSKINCGGITSINGQASSEKVATITNSCVSLSIRMLASSGGIAVTNYGKIANTNFSGKLSNSEQSQFVSEIATAGFVVNNTSNAIISLSYVKCSENGNNISSVGQTAGFVVSNAGTMTNCYISEVKIASQGSIGGFVYKNTGAINNCYSYVDVGSSLFYNEFIYDRSNIGEIVNSYVITDDTKNIGVEGLNKISTSSVTNQELFKGFVFAENGKTGAVWTMSSLGPYLHNAGFNPNVEQYNSTYSIYDVETFEGWFDELENDLVIENVSFKLVRDIDFALEGLTVNPTTINKTLMADFEGNDMILKNYNIYKSNQQVESESDILGVGLFAQIIDACVRNLILQPTSVKATTAVAVGSLAGIIDSSELYNIRVDNSNLLVLGKNVVGGLAGIIKGGFEVVGVTSNVSAFASYVNLSLQQYDLYMGKNVTGIVGDGNISTISYAGSIAGIVDGYTTGASANMTYRSKDNYYTIKNIEITEDLVIIAETVGGAFGLVGECTFVSDISYSLDGETKYQGKYVSGGLVGENRGVIQNSTISALYEMNTNNRLERESTNECFNQNTRVNGAIVGLNIGGLINKCYSDIDICTTANFATAGGIVGRNIAGSVYNCKVYGIVKGYYAGAIAGTDYSYSTMFTLGNAIASATSATKAVYRNVQNVVEYGEGIINGYNNANKYCGNIITKEFLTRFVNDIPYIFSNSADDNSSLVSSTSSIYGLIIGYTTEKYYSYYTIETNENYLTVGTKTTKNILGSDTITKIDGNELNINPMGSVTDNDFPFVDQVNGRMFLYPIAYNGSSYEGWSSILGYNGDYIVVRK